MKILHVAKKYPNALGGDAVVVSNLEKQQTAHGHKVIILTSNCDEIMNGKTIYKFGLKDTSATLDNITIKRLLSLVMLFFKAFAVLRKGRPDIIHTHSIDMAFFISFAARFYKIPIVHTFHIVTYYDKNQSALRRKTELIFARGARPQVVTAPNNYDVKKLREVGLNAVELPNGIDLDFWQAEPKDNLSKNFTFVSVGRLEEQKGNEYLIEATALLRKKTVARFKVIIVGTGSLGTKLKNLADTIGVSDYIDFIGKKSPIETRRIIGTSHAAIFPALYETTPLTLLEAWAMQKPTIATKVGILRDLKKINTTLVVKMQDPNSLSESMYKLMTNPELCSQLSITAHEKVQDLAWTKVNEVAERIYHGAIK